MIPQFVSKNVEIFALVLSIQVCLDVQNKPVSCKFICLWKKNCQILPIYQKQNGMAHSSMECYTLFMGGGWLSVVITHCNIILLLPSITMQKYDIHVGSTISFMTLVNMSKHMKIT